MMLKVMVSVDKTVVFSWHSNKVMMMLKVMVSVNKTVVFSWHSNKVMMTIVMGPNNTITQMDLRMMTSTLISHKIIIQVKVPVDPREMTTIATILKNIMTTKKIKLNNLL